MPEKETHITKEDLLDTDASLIDRVKEGDWDAFEVLVKRYTPRIYSFLYRFLGSQGEAEDIIQEVFLRAYKHAGSYDPQYPLSTWLFTIARRLAINVSRSKNLHSLISLEALLFKGGDENGADKKIDIEMADKRQDPEEGLARKELEKRVNDAVSSLPQRQKSALLLIHFEGLSYEDAAKVMKTSISSIESLVYRAKKRLGVKLAPITNKGSAG